MSLPPLSAQQLAFNQALEAVQAAFDAEVFIYSGGIENRHHGTLVKEVTKPTKRANALLILTTNGGQANAAYKIARLMQRNFAKFTLFAPRTCYSAGTLVALGANALIMDAFGELGPLDVQLSKKNEIVDTKSGLLTASTFDAMSDASFNMFSDFMLNIILSSGGRVSFQTASTLAANMVGQMMSPIFAQMNPDVVGSDHRDVNIAVQYGERLVAVGANADATTVHALVKRYPAHDFIIDDEEAKKLFKNVASPTADLYGVVKPYTRSVYAQANPAFIKRLEPYSPPQSPAIAATTPPTQAPAASNAKQTQAPKPPRRRKAAKSKRANAPQ